MASFARPGTPQRVGGVARVEHQVEQHDRHLVALGHDQLQAVRQRGALQRGQLARGRRTGRGPQLAVDRLLAGRELRERVHLEHVHAVREPGTRGLGHGRGRRLPRARQACLVEVRTAAPDRALRQDVGLAAEAADPLDAAHEAGQPLDARAIELVRRDAVLQQPGELLVDRLLHLCQLAAGPCRGLDHEGAADLGSALERRDVGRDLLVVDQPLVQARALARGEHTRNEVELVVLGRAPLRRVPHLVDARLRHAILEQLALHARALRDPGLVPGERRPWRDVAEVALDLRLRLGRRDVARHHQHRVGRPVVGAEPLLHVVERGGCQVLHRADHGPRVRVALRVDRSLHQLVDAAVGLVLALPLLVLHDAALLVELRLVDGAEQVPHAVRLHPEHGVEGAQRHVLEVVGAVFVRGAVEVGGADPLEHLEVVVVEVLAAVEHQVLEEVREAGLAGLLVLRAHVVPDVHRHDRRLVVLVHDQRQAVAEHELLVGDVGDRDLGGLRRRSADEGEREHESGGAGHRILLFSGLPHSTPGTRRSRAPRGVHVLGRPRGRRLPPMPFPPDRGWRRAASGPTMQAADAAMASAGGGPR